jgi:LacI family transcriptional regulator
MSTQQTTGKNGGARVASLRDIAQELGVSTAAVSKALNDLPGVSDALRLKAKRTAEVLGYKKHLQAGARGDRGLKFIVVLYGRIGGNLMSRIQESTDEEIRRKGFLELRYLIDASKELHTEDRKELFLDMILREPGIAGVLACYIKLSDVSIQRLHEHHIPVVLLENKTEYGRCVTIDQFKASHKAVEKLIALGRRRIACIMPPEDVDHVWRERLDGYRKAIREKGLVYDPSLIVYESNVSMTEGALATRTLIERNPDVDAILFGGDWQAYGGMKALKDAGRRIPQDVAIIGFDDLESNTILSPPLSSVRQPIGKMAKTGLSLLFEAMEKNDYSHRAVVLDTELRLRGSCVADHEEA